MQLSALLAGLSVRRLTGRTDHVVSSVEYDSRRCTPGSLFVAVRGTAADGHAFIADAVRRGAVAVVCERAPDDAGSVTIVEVEDSRKALAMVCHRLHDMPARGMTVVGVTGTNGKTTTTFLLRSLFESRGERVGLIGTTGNYIGDELLPTNFTTPEAPELTALLARVRSAGIRTVVMEVSSHGLELDRVYGIEFSGAIFTNLTQDHLDFHPTMDDYARAKKKLFDAAPADALVLANGDDPYGRFMLRDTKAERAFLYGRSEWCDWRITDERHGLTSSSFALMHDGRVVALTIPLVGRFNVENAAACAAYCLASGWEEETVVRAMSMVRPAPGRMERIALPGGAVAVVDYAHTPDALEKALTACRELVGSGRVICVFGCGGDRDRTKRPLMGRIACSLADAVIVTNDNPRRESPESIVQDILSGTGGCSVRVIYDRAGAIEAACADAAAGDLVLVAGKGHETYQIIGDERLHFDDCEEIRRLAGGERQQVQNVTTEAEDEGG